MSERDDFLLYALSAWGNTQWSKFKELFGNLCLVHMEETDERAEAVARIRAHTLRALESLGHCDAYFGDNSGRIWIAPSVLARLPIRGFPQALLCGSRGPQTIALLEAECSRHQAELQIHSQRRTGYFVPRRVVIKAVDVSSLEQIADSVQVELKSIPPAWTLLDLAPELDTYLDSLQWSPPQEINWQRHDFDANTLQFADRKRESYQSVRLSKYVDPIRSTPRFYLWNRRGRAEIDPDWGRYAVLHSSGDNRLVYDPVTTSLAVPMGAPLPHVLGRVAALCTGYASMHILQQANWGIGSSGSPMFDVFRNVPADIAHTIASKLGQTLVLQDIPV